MKRLILPMAALAAACSSDGPAPALPDSADISAAAATITAGDMYDRIAFLSADSLRGRDTPSPGLDSAAQWIADEMASFGLEPAGEDGWFQRYPFPAETLDRARTGLRATAGATHNFQYGADFFAWHGSPAPAARTIFARSVPESDPGVLRDRAVITVLEARPIAGRQGIAFGRDARNAIGQVRAAARAAGATGVVFVLDPGVTAGEVRALADEAERSRRTLGGVAAAARMPPAFFVRRPAAERMLRMAGVDPAAVLSDSLAYAVPLPGLTLALEAPPRMVDDARPMNVVGRLRGSDPELRDTYVVLSAHMDHMGVGRPNETGDSIYNGADDNASGTSVLIEVAEALARLSERPRRSVLFLAVSGEEKGLLGSRWFSDHPTVPLEAMVANINIDMVGRNAPDSIVVIGQEFSSLGATVQAVADHYRTDVGLIVADDIWPEQRFFFRSDHFNFARQEIPALFFFAGTHEDYHRPSDEVDRIDTDKAARVARLVFHLTLAIASSDQRPEWDPAGLETVRELTRR